MEFRSADAAEVPAGTGARSRTDSPIDGAFMREIDPRATLRFRAGAVSRDLVALSRAIRQVLSDLRAPEVLGRTEAFGSHLVPIW